MPLQIRRGTDVERRAMTVPLAQGELLYVTDDQRLYIGNGATLGGVQITGYTNEDAQDAAASLLTTGTHTGISFTYDDASNKLNATVSLTGYNGFIEGDLQGSVFADNSTRLIDGTNGKFNLNGTVNTSIIPDTNVAYDLGSSSFKFRDLYLSGSSIHLGDSVITSSGTAVNLPAGSLIGGVPIGSGGSDVSGNIIGDDSTVIVNTATKTVTAAGGFVGSLYSNGSTLLVDAAAGEIVGPVDSTSVTGNIYGRYVEISGVSTTDSNQKAGIKIITDGNAEDLYDLFTIDGYKEDDNAMSVVYKRSRGTVSSPAPLLNGDEILGQFWFGADSNADPQLSSAIVATVDASPSAGIVPGKLEFATANSSGTIVVGLSIDKSQTIGVAGGTNLLVAGGSAGQVNTGSVTGYLKINIDGVDRAIPYYSIN